MKNLLSLTINCFISCIINFICFIVLIFMGFITMKLSNMLVGNTEIKAVNEQIFDYFYSTRGEANLSYSLRWPFLIISPMYVIMTYVNVAWVLVLNIGNKMTRSNVSYSLKVDLTIIAMHTIYYFYLISNPEIFKKILYIFLN